MRVKPLKTQTPNMDLEAVAELLKSLDIPEGVIPDLSVASTIPKKQMRGLFEEVFKNTDLDFTRVSDLNHTYIDRRVEAVYVSFKYTLVQHRLSIMRVKRNLSRDCVQGPYIVGLQITDGTVQFGYRPFKHSNFERAQEEANKLRDKNDKSYTVFGVVGHALKDPNRPSHINTPVEESKQGVKGKIGPSPLKVMEDWKKIIQENDLTVVNVPVSIGFLVSGKYRIGFSLSQELVCFDEYTQCIDFINRWIRDYRSNYSETPQTVPTVVC